MKRASAFIAALVAMSFLPILPCRLGSSLLSGQSVFPDPPAPGATGSDPEEQRAFRLFETALRRVPRDFSLTNVPVEDLHKRVDLSLKLGRDYIAAHAKGPNRRVVLMETAWLISVNGQRNYLERYQAWKSLNNQQTPPEDVRAIWKAEICAEAIGYADEALTLEPTPEQTVQVLKTKAQSYYFAEEPLKAVAIYERLMAEFPGHGGDDQTLISLIACLIHPDVKRFDAASQRCDEFMAKHPDSSFLPHVISYRGKALLQGGRPQDAIRHWEKYTDALRAGASRSAQDREGQKLREEYDKYLDRVDFHLAFLLYSQGRADEAKEHLKKCIDFLTDKKVKAAEKPGEVSFSPASDVYLTRAQRVLSSIERLHGKPAPDLQLGDGWLNNAPFDPAAEIGNVVALYFAPYDQRRPEEFGRELQSFYEEFWTDGFRAAWISYPRGRKDLPGQVVRLGQQLRGLGISYPAGIDLHPGYTTHEEYSVARGTSTLILLDREGKVAWYKMDPTYRDFGLARNVVERLLGVR